MTHRSPPEKPNRRSSLLAFVLVAAAALGEAAAKAQTWAIEDVLDPPTWSPGISSLWTASWPQPALRSGIHGSAFYAQDESGLGVSDQFVGFQESGTASRRVLVSVGQPGYVHPSNTLVLSTPGNPRLVAKDPGSSIRHVVVDIRSGSLIGSIGQVSAPGAGLLTPQVVHEAGDLNGDGFDDFFLDFFGPGTTTGHVAATSLVDGASLSLSWLAWEPGFELAVFFFGPGSPPDFDQDSFSDQLLIATWTNPSTLLSETKLIALSGTDGSEIWRATVPSVASGPNRVVPDSTGDGTPDLVVTHFDPASGSKVTHLLDGSSGASVWQTPITVADPHFVQGSLFATDFGGVLTLGSHPTTGVLELVQVIYGSYLNGDVEWAYMHLDAGTGGLRSVSADPVTLEPWHTDPLSINISLGTLHWPVGDIDRDGLEENAALAEAVGWPTNGFQESRRLVIIGQETLDCPDHVQLGGTMQLDVGIPSAGGMECVLLAATAFDGGGGLVLDGWKTNLSAGDPVLQNTLQTRAYSTTLDNLGRGSFLVAVPPFPQLAGQTLYLRAVALEPGTTSEVWTLSTLGIVEIL